MREGWSGTGRIAWMRMDGLGWDDPGWRGVGRYGVGPMGGVGWDWMGWTSGIGSDGIGWELL